MRAKWEVHSDRDEELHLHTSEGWVYMGWVEPERDGYRPLCMWLKDSHGDYPENTVFETAKQARRALKAAAIVAVIGGFRGRNEQNF
jgi:hypothetical protein